MEKIAIITDTTSDLTQEIIEKYNINILPFRIIYKDREYRDKVEISSHEVYAGLKKEIPTSSMPALQDMEDIYERLEKEGYTHVIGITLSSGLSGIYNGLTLASSNHPKIKSFIFDSKAISLGEGALAEECGRLIAEGKNFDFIVNSLPSIRNRVNVYFVVGTLEYLIKGGRIGRVSGTIGELLNLKPIIAVGQDGKYFTYDKVRGRKQSLNKLIDIAKQTTEKKKCRAYIMHGGSEEDALRVYEIISKLPNVMSTTYGGCISPVSGVHTGPGLVGLVLFEEE